MSKGKLIVISGFSGAGKGTIIKNIMQKHPGEYAFSVSATTRSIRPGEVDGKDYFFVSKDEFEKMIAQEKLLEYALYGDNYYGTPSEPIDKMLEEGKNIILDIEVNGMHNITSKRPNVSTVFVIPPSSEDLINRLIKRGTETKEQLTNRLIKATEEAKFAFEYGFILQNGDIEKCSNEFEEYLKTGKQDENIRLKNLALTQEICEGIKKYIKQGE